jgi:DNA-binding NarL/FixJ family response regulator
MGGRQVRCVVLGERHGALAESIRGLLSSSYDVVVMVADEPSLLETLRRMDAQLAVVDLSLTQGDGRLLVRGLRAQFPGLRIVAISVHDEPAARRAALEAGASAFVAKSDLAFGLLPATAQALGVALGPP